MGQLDFDIEHNVPKESGSRRIWTREMAQHVKPFAAHATTHIKSWMQWLCLYSQPS